MLFFKTDRKLNISPSSSVLIFSRVTNKDTTQHLNFQKLIEKLYHKGKKQKNTNVNKSHDEYPIQSKYGIFGVLVCPFFKQYSHPSLGDAEFCSAGFPVPSDDNFAFW